MGKTKKRGGGGSIETGRSNEGDRDVINPVDVAPKRSDDEIAADALLTELTAQGIKFGVELPSTIEPSAEEVALLRRDVIQQRLNELTANDGKTRKEKAFLTTLLTDSKRTPKNELEKKAAKNIHKLTIARALDEKVARAKQHIEAAQKAATEPVAAVEPVEPTKSAGDPKSITPDRKKRLVDLTNPASREAYDRAFSEELELLDPEERKKIIAANGKDQKQRRGGDVLLLAPFRKRVSERLDAYAAAENADSVVADVVPDESLTGDLSSDLQTADNSDPFSGRTLDEVRTAWNKKVKELKNLPGGPSPDAQLLRDALNVPQGKRTPEQRDVILKYRESLFPSEVTNQDALAPDVAKDSAVEEAAIRERFSHEGLRVTFNGDDDCYVMIAEKPENGDAIVVFRLKTREIAVTTAKELAATNPLDQTIQNDMSWEQINALSRSHSGPDTILTKLSEMDALPQEVRGRLVDTRDQQLTQLEANEKLTEKLWPLIDKKQVTVVRTSGDVEHDWTPSDIYPESGEIMIVVQKRDGKDWLKRRVPLSEFKKNNPDLALDVVAPTPDTVPVAPSTETQADREQQLLTQFAPGTRIKLSNDQDWYIALSEKKDDGTGSAFVINPRTHGVSVMPLADIALQNPDPQALKPVYPLLELNKLFTGVGPGDGAVDLIQTSDRLTDTEKQRFIAARRTQLNQLAAASVGLPSRGSGETAPGAPVPTNEAAAVTPATPVETTPGAPATEAGATTTETAPTIAPSPETKFRIGAFLRNNTDALSKAGIQIMMARVLGSWAAIPRLYDVVQYMKQATNINGRSKLGFGKKTQLSLSENMAIAMRLTKREEDVLDPAKRAELETKLQGTTDVLERIELERVLTRNEGKRNRIEIMAQMIGETDPKKIAQLESQLEQNTVRGTLARYNEQLKSVRGGEKVLMRDEDGKPVPFTNRSGEVIHDRDGNIKYKTAQTPERQMQAQLLRELRHRNDLTEADRLSVVEKLNDRYLDTKVTGLQAAKQLFNSALGITSIAFGPGGVPPVAATLRLANYGIFDALSHKRRMEQAPMYASMEQRNQLKRESLEARATGNEELADQKWEEMRGMTLESLIANERNVDFGAAFKDSFATTWQTIRGKKPNTTLFQKVAAWGKVATYVGLGVMAFESNAIAHVLHGDPAHPEHPGGLEDTATGKHEAPADSARVVPGVVRTADGETRVPATAEGIAHGDTANRALEAARKAREAASKLPAASGTSSPELAPPLPTLPESAVETAHFEYQGGTSIWGEATRQIEARFSGKMAEIAKGYEENPKAIDAIRTYNIDHMKDIITANPQGYGLPKGVNIDRLTEAQLRNINWDQAARDAFPTKDPIFTPSETQILSIARNNEAIRSFTAEHPNVPLTGETVTKVLTGHGAEHAEAMARHIETETVDTAATMGHASVAELIQPTDTAFFQSHDLATSLQHEMQLDVVRALNGGKGGDIADQVSLYKKFGLDANEHDHFMDILRSYKDEHGGGTAWNNLGDKDNAHAINELATMDDKDKIAELQSVVVPQEGRRFIEHLSNISKTLTRDFTSSEITALKEKFGVDSTRHLGVIVRGYMAEHRSENLNAHQAIEKLAAKDTSANKVLDDLGGNTEVAKVVEHAKSIEAAHPTPEALDTAHKAVDQLPQSEKEWNALPEATRKSAEHWAKMAEAFKLGPNAEINDPSSAVYPNLHASMDPDYTIHYSYNGATETIKAPETELMAMDKMKELLGGIDSGTRAQYNAWLEVTNLKRGGEFHQDDYSGERLTATMDESLTLYIHWGSRHFTLPDPDRFPKFSGSK